MHKMRVVKYGLLMGLLPVLMAANGCFNIPGTQSVTVSSGSSTDTVVAFKVQFTNDVSSLTSSDVVVGGTAGASLDSISGSGSVWTVEAAGMTKAGTVTLVVKANTVTGLLTDSEPFSVQFTPVVPAEPVSVSIGAPSVATTKNGPVTFTVTYTNAKTVSLGAGDVQVVAVGLVSGVASVASGSTASEKVVTLSSIQGNGTLAIKVAADTAVNADGVAGSAADVASSSPVLVDNTVPVVTIGAPDKTITNAGPVNFSIATDADATLDLTKVSIVGSVTGTLDTSVAGTITVKSITGNGTFHIAVAAGAAKDAAGNASVAVNSADVTVDNNVPSFDAVTPIAIVDAADPWLTSTVYFRVKFNEPVASITTVTFTGSNGFTVLTKATWTATAETTDGKSWLVGVSGMDANVAAGGSAIAIQIPVGSVKDAAGNSNLVPASLAPVNGWTKPASFTITADANPTNVNPVFHIVSTAATTAELTAANTKLRLSGNTTGADTLTVAVVAAKTKWDVTVSKAGGTLTSGTVTLTLDAGALTIAGSALPSPAVTSPTVTVDNGKPGVAIALAAGQAAYISGANTTVNFTATFTKDMKTGAGQATDFTKYTVVLPGAAASANGVVSGSTLKVFNVKFDVTGFNVYGNITVSMAAGAVQDTSSNVNTASPTPDAKIVVYKSLGDVVSAVVLPSAKNTVEVTFNHDMNKASVENKAAYAVAGQTITSVTQQTDLKVVRVVTDATDLTGKTLSIGNGVAVTDMAGNGLLAPFSKVLSYTSVAPKVVGISRTSNKTVNLTFDQMLDSTTVTAAGAFTGATAGNAFGTNDPTATLDATLKVVTLTFPNVADGGKVRVTTNVKTLGGTASAQTDYNLFLDISTVTFGQSTDGKTVTVNFGTLYAAIDPATVLASSFAVHADGNLANPVVVINSVTLDTTGKIVTLVLAGDCSPAGAGKVVVVAGGIKTVDGVTVPADIVSAALP